MGIPGLLVGHPAGQEDVDQALRLAFLADVVLLLRLGLAHLEETAEGQTKSAHQAGVEKIAPGPHRGLRGFRTVFFAH